MKKVFLVFAAIFVAVSCGDKKEPFDVLAAQRKMAGKWECTEEDGGKSYQITLAAEGVMNMTIKNLCDRGEQESVVVNLLSETSLLIPTQQKDGYSVEGNGSISEEYRKMVLDLNFNEGSGAKKIIVTCSKTAQ